MSECLTEQLAQRYLSGGCSEDEQQAIKTHFTTCQDCRQQIEALRSKTGASDQLDSTRTGGESTGEKSGEQMPDDVTLDEFTTMSIAQDSLSQRSSRGHAQPSESTIEGYEILEQLPLGGQAIVYKAIQQATKRIVALKVLLQSSHLSTRAQYRFEREVDLAASLQHPNIVTIYDSGIARGQYYFAMQYVEGKPLDKYVQSEKMSARQIMELFNKVCSAVAYAHQRGVIHRDLKPDNILVDDDGQPHILDFGLAKLVDGSEQVSPDMVMTSIPGKVIGTLAFMSPEQASAQPDAIDVRTDVYSIGVILYRIITGTFPYNVSGAMLAILRSIQEAEPTRPSKIISRLDSEIEAILLKALAKDSERRYQSAAHLQHDIDYWLKGLPIEAKSDSSIYLLRKIITRHYYASAVVALLLVIIFGFSCFYYQLYSKLRKTNTTLESTIQALVHETAQYDNLAREASFVSFLQAWHAGQVRQSRFIAKRLAARTREMKAAFFLLNPKPLTEKSAQFRQDLEQSEPYFVEFIIAEHRLKNGDEEEAIKGYRKCLSLNGTGQKDRWLSLLIESRLFKLINENDQGNISP